MQSITRVNRFLRSYAREALPVPAVAPPPVHPPAAPSYGVADQTGTPSSKFYKKNSAKRNRLPTGGVVRPSYHEWPTGRAAEKRLNWRGNGLRGAAGRRIA
jgi:hypothetical protein